MKKYSMIISFSVIIIFAIIGIVMFFCKEKEIKDFKVYAKTLDDAIIEKNKKIYALGEATHGNKEFQVLKLTVLKKLVEENNVRAFCLEGDFGEIINVNKFVKGNLDISINEAVNYLGFKIYKTEEMKNLIQWIKEYNEKNSDDMISIYGFDMQNYEENLKYLNNIYETNMLLNKNGESKKIDLKDLNKDEKISLINDIKNELTEIINSSSSTSNDSQSFNIEKIEYALQCAICLEQNIQLSTAGNLEYSQLRDSYMAQNIDWILNKENKKGNEAIMISGHNGHVSKEQTSFCYMGNILKEKFKDDYYVIGTDYYVTECNINSSSGRKVFTLTSFDPFALQVKDMEENEYYLDFSEANKSDELRKYINKKMNMGSLGDGFESFYKYLPWTYKITSVPADNYDAMIFVYKATAFTLVNNVSLE